MPIRISQMPGKRPRSPARLSDGSEHHEGGDSMSGTGATPSPVTARLIRMVRAEAAAIQQWEALSVPERRAYKMAVGVRRK